MIRRTSTPLGVNWSHPLNRGLKIWCPMQESDGLKVRDIASGINGTITNSTAAAAWVPAVGANTKCCPAKTRYALKLDDTDDLVSFGVDFATLTGGTYTVSCWYDFDELDGDIVSDFESSPYPFLLRQQGGTLQVWHDFVKKIDYSHTAASTWEYVTATYDGTTIRLYLDGKEVASAAASAPSVGGALAFQLGKSVGSVHPTNGLITDFRVHSRALSAAEVKDLYRASRTGSADLYRYSRWGFSPQHHARRSVAIRRTEQALPGLVARYNTELTGGDFRNAVKPGSGTLTGTTVFKSKPSTSAGTSRWRGQTAWHLPAYADSIDVAAADNPLAGLGEFSLLFWFYPTGTTGSYSRLISNGTNDDFEIAWRSVGGTLEVFNRNQSPNGWRVLATGISPVVDHWRHVCLTLGANGMVAYIDGVRTGSHATAYAKGIDGILSIGNRYAGTEGIHGYYNDIQVYNRVLTETEVRHVCNQGHIRSSRIIPARTQTYESSKGVVRKATTPDVTQGLVWGWDARSGGGALIQDIVGHGHLLADAPSGVHRYYLDSNVTGAAGNHQVNDLSEYTIVLDMDVKGDGATWGGFFGTSDGASNGVMMQRNSSSTTDIAVYHASKYMFTGLLTSLKNAGRCVFCLTFGGYEDVIRAFLNGIDVQNISAVAPVTRNKIHLGEERTGANSNARIYSAYLFNRNVTPRGVAEITNRLKQGQILTHRFRIIPANKRLIDPSLTNPTESSITDTTATISITTDTTE